MIARRARLYDALALLTAIVVIALDQWTKALVVEYLSPAGSKPFVPLIGQYLVLDYIQNRGAAFSLLANSAFLAVLIVAAICVVAYLYIRALNTGPLLFKVILGMIIGGAFGNLIDRIHNGGYVVDFIFFRIPQISYQFAVFNLADACISVGVVLLFIFVVFGGMHWTETQESRDAKEHSAVSPSSQVGAPERTREQDAQS